MAKKKESLPPGAAPIVQGYWSAVWGAKREIPKKYKYLPQSWKDEWFKGYDEYGQLKHRIDGNGRRV